MAKKMLPGAKRAGNPSPSPQPQPKPTPPGRVQGPVLPKNTAPSRVLSPNPIAKGGTGTGTPNSSPYYGTGDPGGGIMGGLMGGDPSLGLGVSEEDYLAGDSAYQAQVAALKGALERYQADAGLQRTNYNTDYAAGLRDLGYDEMNKTWNWDDTLTASGRANQNQLNDFASRGMLQSQGYADENTNLQRMLGQQYDQMATNKTNFLSELDRGLANFQGENTSSQQAARAEAIARRAATYGI